MFYCCFTNTYLVGGTGLDVNAVAPPQSRVFRAILVRLLTFGSILVYPYYGHFMGQALRSCLGPFKLNCLPFRCLDIERRSDCRGHYPD